jgi:sortase A
MSSNRSGFLFLFLGALFIIVSLSWRIHQRTVLSFEGKVPPPQVTKVKATPPKSIHILSLNINLNIEEGFIQDGIWKISETGATHLNSSGNPGDGGNVVIYGHNKNKLFGPILWIKVGSEIKLSTEDEKEYFYIVTDTKTVDPKEINYVLPKTEETLTLYTCTGFLDTKRFIVVAKPKS